MKKVVVGMSGGVDSSVAAYLLKQEGYEVIGVTMQIWQDGAEDAEESGCCGLSAVEDARRVAERLKIPHYVMNFKKEFRAHVMDYFVSEYVKGRTPNPACPATGMYRGHRDCSGAERSGQTISPLDIMPGWIGFQTADMPCKSP